MAQQTAVQFLVMRYHQWQGVLKDRDIEEAKAMEKEQIQKAFSHGEELPINPLLPNYSSNEYYNDTYENNS